jgi:hypothetical protein
VTSKFHLCFVLFLSLHHAEWGKGKNEVVAYSASQAAIKATATQKDCCMLVHNQAEGNMRNIYGVFLLLTLSITSSFAATGGKRVATMKEFNSVVCPYIERKMKEGLNTKGVEKLINENAQTIEVLSSIYSNLDCAHK